MPIEFGIAQTSFPTLDGIISDGEWANSQEYTIRMNNGIDIDLKVIYSEIDAYYLVTFPHNGPDDVIERDPAAGRHDYFGIEFDVNNDGVIMGNPSSPDDMVLIDYDEPGAVDMFSHSFKVFKDADYDGQNNVAGVSNDKDGILIYEFRKALNSNDAEGNDISLKEGDSYYIMPAIWDDRNIHSAAGAVNVQIGNSHFLELTVGKTDSDIVNELIVGGAIVLAVGMLGVLVYFKSKSNPVL